jgi:O-antigen biosynthesis protein
VRIFAAHDGGSGCALAYYRMLLPLGELAKHDGYEVLFAIGQQQDKFGRVTGGVHAKDMVGYDLIIGQRFNSHTGLQVWRGARTPTSRIVYEQDDDVFTVGPENFQAYHLYQREEIRDAITHCLETADLVTVSTPHLAGAMRKAVLEYNPDADPNIVVLPNYVPGFTLDIERRRRDRPCVGWAGGASHGRDVHLALPSARRFLKRFPGWDFHLIGTDYRRSMYKQPNRRVVFTEWTHIVDHPREYFESLDFDIALAPLLDTEFSRSKSPLKAIEAMSLGIPVVATRGPVYGQVIDHGVNGFLAGPDHEWLKCISELASDETLREKMGAAARESARAWTIERNWTRWADAYERLWP